MPSSRHARRPEADGYDSIPGLLVPGVHRPTPCTQAAPALSQIAAPVQPLSPSTAFHAALTEEQLRGGASHADLVAAFARFLRPADVVGAWGTHGLSLFDAAGGALPARLDLRTVGQRLTHQKLGGLEAYAATLPAPPSALPIPGRAGRRLALLAKIVASWRASGADAE